MREGTTSQLFGQAGRIISLAGKLAHRTWRAALLCAAVLTAVWAVAQMVIGEQGMLMIGSLASFVTQYWLTRHLTEYVGLRRGHGAVGLFFAMSLVSQLGIFLGLMLVVIPGWWLAARWLLAGPILLRDEIGAIDALRQSWRETRGRVFAIMLVLALASLPTIGALAVYMVLEPYSWTWAIIENMAFGVGQITFWYAAVAICADREDDNSARSSSA